MADFYRTVDGIRAYLLSGESSFQESLRTLADDYAQDCREANERLARCARLLSQGLRSEAIHHAEAPPNLLDMLAILDFIERPAWVEVATRFSLTSPPPLDLKSAEFLDTAYADQNPLDNLLKRHRRLALARAPLAERIQVLREIAHLDSTNTIWAQDVLTYEQARLKQIPNEANEAARRLDTETLEAIDQELASTKWSARPSPGLVQSVRTALDGIRQTVARRDLELLEDPLHDACVAQDLATARAFREKWQAAARFARLEPGHPLLERVEGDLAWIDGEDRREADEAQYEKAQARLRDGLDARVRRPELERLHDDLIACGREVPPDLEKAYDDRIADLKRAERWKQIIAMVTGVAALIVLGAIAIVMYREQVRSARALAIAESLQAAVDAGQIGDLEILLTRYEGEDPASLKSAEVIAVWPGVERLRGEEADRVEKLLARLTEIDGSPPSEAEPPAVAEASKLVRSDDDRGRLDQARSRWSKRRQEEIDRLDRELLPELELLEGELLALADVPVDSAGPAAPASLERLAEEWRRRMPASGPLSAAVRDQSSRIDQLIRKLRGLADARNRQRSAAAQLSRVVDRQPLDPAEYASALTELAQSHEGTPDQADVRRVLGDDERTAWESAIAWSNLVRPWAGLREPLSPETARQRIDQLQRLRTRWPHLPDRAPIDSYRNDLQAISRRDDPNGGLKTRLTSKLLSDLVIDPLWMVKYHTTDGSGFRKYYSVVSPPSKQSYQLGYIVDYNGRDAPKKKSIAANLVLYNDWSPQSQIARALKRELQQATAMTRWDSVMLHAARKITADAEMDPLCKVLFLNGLIDAATEGSASLKTAMGRHLEDLIQTKRRFETICWMNPDLDADKNRVEAARFLEGLPWDEIERTCQREDDTRRRWLLAQPTPTGWIDRDPDGWTCHLAATTAGGEGELVVAARDGEQTVWRIVGRLDGNPRKATLTDPASMAIGRLVFLRRRTSPADR